MDAGTDKQQHEHGGIHFLALTVATAAVTTILAVALLLSTYGISIESAALQQANDRYVACETAINDLMEASTYLTTQSRLFASTYHTTYLDNYYWVMSKTQRREADVDVFREYYPESEAAEYAESALEFSNRLSKNELYAMKLMVEALDLDVDDEIAAELDQIAFVHGDENLSKSDMLEKAHMLVTYEPYEHDVDRVAQQVEHCKDALAESLEVDKRQHTEALNGLFMLQQIITVALLVLVLSAAVVFIVTMTLPIKEFINRITRNELLEEKGAYELRFLACAYNKIHEENQLARERLTFEAEHDALTGLYNRGACERIITEHRQSPMAMVIIDVDHFKEVNDQYGHGCGDRVLQEVSKALRDAFEPEGAPCRLGGDEFVVLLLGTADELRRIVEQRVREISDKLIKPHDDLPSIAISAGAAFGDGTQVSGELYKLADKALYRVKDAGRHGMAFDGGAGIISLGK